MSDNGFYDFPPNFTWGAATSAYQIEGAWNEGGRGLSIWDTFCRQPGKIQTGESGDVAADHYHRWAQDIGIMKELGLKAYRFSVAWPRIVPLGAGAVNSAGLDFYDRMVDALLEHHIEPWVTLFHWDLPQALQDLGGWTNRETALRFGDYCRVVADRLGDRVSCWITHNEPFVAAVAGHLSGEHAPGLQNPVAAFQAAHHLLLSHGYGVEALRAALPRPSRIGITLNLNPTYPLSDSEQDHQAAVRMDGILNRLFLDPIFRGHYPEDVLTMLGELLPAIAPEDLSRIAAPLDFLGINYYTRVVVRDDPNFPFVQAIQVQPQGNEYSQMWEIYPQGLYDLLTQVYADYRPADIVVTENGVPVPDGLDFDGRIRDIRRTRYLRDHLAEVHRAIGDGIPVSGYFVWSLLDNFEWQLGYRMRFGLVYVDFKTQARAIKDSGQWYSQVVRANGFSRNGDHPLLPC